MRAIESRLQEDRLLTLNEVADYLGVSVSQARRIVKHNCSIVKLDAKIRVPFSEIVRYVDSCTVSPELNHIIESQVRQSISQEDWEDVTRMSDAFNRDVV